MVSAVVFKFGGMRCQPLRRALAVTVQWRHNVSHS
ncbi:acetyltransferase [Vibrio cholerae]|nr:acetyltransferase [Vibrio cholerae]EGR2283763.1 acetyltransferase [Vibrio cholerae]